MANYFALAAVGLNRPGIVADVSGVIYQSGCNLEDSSMSLLGNQFALSILASSPDAEAQRKVEEGAAALEGKGLKIHVFSLPGEASEPPDREPEPNYTIMVEGMDRAGIVYHTSKLLADQGVDVLDLQTHIMYAPESGTPIFTMHADLSAPEGLDEDLLAERLEQLSEDLLVDIALEAFE